MDEIWMITPEPCFNIDGRKARSSRTAANRFVSNAYCQSSSDNANAPPPGAAEPPTLWIRDVEAAETIHNRLDDLIDPFARADVCLDEPIGRAALEQGSCSGDHLSTSANEAVHNGFANAPGSTRNQDSSAREIGCFSCLPFILHECHPFSKGDA